MAQEQDAGHPSPLLSRPPQWSSRLKGLWQLPGQNRRLRSWYPAAGLGNWLLRSCLMNGEGSRGAAFLFPHSLNSITLF